MARVASACFFIKFADIILIIYLNNYINLRIVTPPTTFFIPKSSLHQNPFIKPGEVNAMHQYKNVCKIISPYEYVVTSTIIPDFVFIE